MVISVLSSIASTKPSPSVLSAARNARIFSVAGTCSCASGTTARSLTMERPPMLLAPSSIGMVGLTKLPLASVWPTRSSVNLAGTAADRVLMTICAGPLVEDRPKPAVDVVSQFVNLLVEGEAVAGRFRDPVADAARAGILDEGRRIEPGGRFRGGLLGRRHRDPRSTQDQHDQPIFRGDHQQLPDTSTDQDHGR